MIEISSHTFQAFLLILVNIIILGGVYTRITNQITRNSTIIETFNDRITSLENEIFKSKE